MHIAAILALKTQNYREWITQVWARNLKNQVKNQKDKNPSGLNKPKR